MSRLSQNDATIVAAQAEARSLIEAGAFEPDHRNADRLMTRWAALANKIERTPADTIDGLRAKALSLLDEIEAADADDEIAASAVESLINDLLRLTGGVLS
jgi:hypothetical protein